MSVVSMYISVGMLPHYGGGGGGGRHGTCYLGSYMDAVFELVVHKNHHIGLSRTPWGSMNKWISKIKKTSINRML